MDYQGLAALLQQYSPVQRVGDVLPFQRRSIEPGMGLTEGAKPYQGGANARITEPQRNNIINILSGNTADPRWAEIDRFATAQGLRVTPENIQHTLDLMDKNGLSMDQVKYQLALIKQSK